MLNMQGHLEAFCAEQSQVRASSQRTEEVSALSLTLTLPYRVLSRVIVIGACARIGPGLGCSYQCEMR